MKDFGELLSTLYKWLSPGSALAIAILVSAAIALISRIDTLYQVFEKFRSLRIRELTDLANLTQITEKTRSALTDEIDRKTFTKLTSLDLSSSQRDAVHLVVGLSNGAISYRDFRVAHSFIAFEGNRLIVKISWFDKAFSGVIRLAAIVLFLLALFIGVVAFIQLIARYAEPGNDHYISFLTEFGGFFAMIVSSVFAASVAYPVVFAQEFSRRLESEITRSDANDTQSSASSYKNIST